MNSARMDPDSAIDRMVALMMLSHAANRSVPIHQIYSWGTSDCAQVDWAWSKEHAVRFIAKWNKDFSFPGRIYDPQAVINAHRSIAENHLSCLIPQLLGDAEPLGASLFEELELIRSRLGNATGWEQAFAHSVLIEALSRSLSGPSGTRTVKVEHFLSRSQTRNDALRHWFQESPMVDGTGLSVLFGHALAVTPPTAIAARHVPENQWLNAYAAVDGEPMVPSFGRPTLGRPTFDDSDDEVDIVWQTPELIVASALRYIRSKVARGALVFLEELWIPLVQAAVISRWVDHNSLRSSA